MRKFLLTLSYVLTSFILVLSSPSPVSAGNICGVNIGDNHSHVDQVVNLTKSGGWVAAFGSPGDCGSFESLFGKNLNVVIRAYNGNQTFTNDQALGWVATLGKMANQGQMIYFMPWNEPNHADENKPNNRPATANEVLEYTNFLRDNLSQAGLLNKKVILLSPMIDKLNDSFINNTFFNNPGGRTGFYSGFGGSSINEYDQAANPSNYEPCRAGLNEMNNCKYREIGIPGPYFSLETGVAGTATPPRYLDNEIKTMLEGSWAAWNHPSFRMFAIFSYDPHRSGWNIFNTSETADFYKSHCVTGSVDSSSFSPQDQQKFDQWFNQHQSQLYHCGGCGYVPAGKPELCQATGRFPFIPLTCKPIEGADFSTECGGPPISIHAKTYYSSFDPGCIKKSYQGEIKINNLEIPFAQDLADYFTGILDFEHLSDRGLQPGQITARQFLQESGVFAKLSPEGLQDDLKLEFLTEIQERIINNIPTRYAQFKINGLGPEEIKNRFLAIRQKRKNFQPLNAIDLQFLNQIWFQIPLFANEESKGYVNFSGDGASGTVETSIPEVYRLAKVTTKLQELLYPRDILKPGIHVSPSPPPVVTPTPPGPIPTNTPRPTATPRPPSPPPGPTVTPTLPPGTNDITGLYLVTFDACNLTTTDCSNLQNHSVYLVQSSDGLSWNPVPGWTPYSGHAPDVIRRGEILYVYTPGQVRRYRFDSKSWESPTPVNLDDPEATGGYIDPSLTLDDQEKLVMFYLLGAVGENPYRCASGQTTCAKQIRSATERLGSNGTEFLLTPEDGTRLTIDLSAEQSVSNPDIFVSTANPPEKQYLLYLSRESSLQVYTSNSLRGTYNLSTTLPEGKLVTQEGVASGYYDSATSKYWTLFQPASSPSVIKRAIHSSFDTPLTFADFTEILNAGNLGLGNTALLDSPGFALNSPALSLRETTPNNGGGLLGLIKRIFKGSGTSAQEKKYLAQGACAYDIQILAPASASPGQYTFKSRAIITTGSCTKDVCDIHDLRISYLKNGVAVGGCTCGLIGCFGRTPVPPYSCLPCANWQRWSPEDFGGCTGSCSAPSVNMDYGDTYTVSISHSDATTGCPACKALSGSCTIQLTSTGWTGCIAGPPPDPCPPTEDTTANQCLKEAKPGPPQSPACSELSTQTYPNFSGQFQFKNTLTHIIIIDPITGLPIIIPRFGSKEMKVEANVYNTVPYLTKIAQNTVDRESVGSTGNLILPPGFFRTFLPWMQDQGGNFTEPEVKEAFKDLPAEDTVGFSLQITQKDSGLTIDPLSQTGNLRLLFAKLATIFNVKELIGGQVFIPF